MKVGDKVLVTKPKNIDQDPGWISWRMDIYDGTIQTILALEEEGWILFEEDGFSFHPNWLEIVEEKSINEDMLLL